ncbi:MAG: ATP-binding protein [Flavipsychrobacter sp.]|nr:ATP-binding protein [Flavipsychrobacter sp.]
MTDNDIIFTVVFTTLIILLLIAGVALTIFIANRQRMQQETKMAKMQVDYEKELRQVEGEVQEQVLVHVARELHDNIGQLLTTMHLQMEHSRMDMPELTGMLKPLHETLGDTIIQVKLLGKSLNSDVLEQNGLVNTMQMEIYRMQQLNRFKIHWQHDDTEPDLGKDQKLMTYRVFQEILNNAMKHAEAQNIYVELKGRGEFGLIVRDDGNGFDLEDTLQTGGGSGLRNMMKRAVLANLNIKIDTEKGKGSIFTLG